VRKLSGRDRPEIHRGGDHSFFGNFGLYILVLSVHCCMSRSMGWDNRAFNCWDGVRPVQRTMLASTCQRMLVVQYCVVQDCRSFWLLAFHEKRRHFVSLYHYYYFFESSIRSRTLLTMRTSTHKFSNFWTKGAAARPPTFASFVQCRLELASSTSNVLARQHTISQSRPL
jgi:hypothetical protein